MQEKAIDLDCLLSDPFIDDNRLAAFLYSDQRARGIVKRLLARKGVLFAEFDEILQRAVMAFFEKSKKDDTRILNRLSEDGKKIDVEGFYRVWWRVIEIVILDYQREYFRHDHFNDDDHEESVIQQASIAEACNSVAFEDKIGTQMMFDKFNSIFERAATDRIKNIVTKVIEAPVSQKPKGRPPGSSKKHPKNESLPFVSGVVFKPVAFDPDSDSARKSARLAAIRKSLGISIAEYALKLGISEFRLSSYIYGKVKMIPLEVIQNAETLFEAEKGVVVAIVAIDAMEMPEILSAWRKSIRGSNDELIQLFNISSSTMVRWESGLTRPSIRKIRSYNQLVDAAARLVRSKRK